MFSNGSHVCNEDPPACFCSTGGADSAAGCGYRSVPNKVTLNRPVRFRPDVPLDYFKKNLGYLIHTL